MTLLFLILYNIYFFFNRMGLVAVQILNVYNASHISAKLLYVNCTKNRDEINLWSKVEDHSDSIKHELKTFYSNPDSRYI